MGRCPLQSCNRYYFPYYYSILDIAILKEKGWYFLKISVMIDLVIVLLLALMAFFGWRKGMIRSLVELASAVLAVLLAYQFAGFVTPLLIDHTIRPAAYQAVAKQVNTLDMAVLDLSPKEEVDALLDAIPNDFIREQARNLWEKLPLSEDLPEATTRESLLEMSRQAVDTALDTAVYDAVRAIVCMVAFIVLTAVFHLAAGLLNLFAKLPVIHQANAIGGMLLGMAKGLLLTGLVVWVVCGLNLVDETTVEQTYILKFLAGILPVSGEKTGLPADLNTIIP